MARADGAVIIDTRINTGGFKTGAANLKSQFAGLGKAAGKLGMAIAAVFSVRAIVNFSKEAIELGSDLQEVQNVVDSTFTTMNDQLNTFARGAAKAAGLSETMAKKYAGTFGAMAKSFRFSEEEAYTMATTLTQLTGDIASFYNLTQDEAYTKLKSVFTGETEALKELGVVMTEAALNDFALRKGMNKTVNKMSEQEKVALRYSFVLEQLDTASGDFIRTQDSWANQTKILALQTEQLKATIGQGLINALTPIIKTVNILIEKLQVAAVAFRDFTATIFGDASSANDAVGSITDGTNDLEESLEDVETAAKRALAPFDEIVKLGDTAEKASDTSVSIPGSSTSTKPTENPGEAMIPGLQAAIDKIMLILKPLQEMDLSMLSESLQELWNSLSGFGDMVLTKLEGAWLDVLVPLSKWTIEEGAPAAVKNLSEWIQKLTETGNKLDFGPLVESSKKLGEAYIGLAKVIDEKLKWAYDTVLEPLAEWTIEEAVPHAVDWLAESFTALSGTVAKLDFSPLTSSVGALAGKFLELTEYLLNEFDWVYTDILEPLAEWAIEEAAPAAVDLLTAAFDLLVVAISPVVDALDDLWLILEPIVIWIEEKVLDALTEFKAHFAMLSNKISEKGPAIEEIFKNIGSVVSKLWDVAKPILDKIWEALKKVADITMTSLGNQIQITIDKLQALSKILLAISTGNWDEAWEGFKELLGACAAEAKNACGWLTSILKINFEYSGLGFIVDLIKNFEDYCEKAYDWLNKIASSDWWNQDWFQNILKGAYDGVFGTSFASTPYATTGYSLPHLAKGTVIPPNAPFAAILGDQKRGTNIEAPLSTIQEAVALVMEDQFAGMMSGFEALLEENRRLRSVVESIEVGDTVIGQAANRYNRKMNTARGGV